MPCGLPGAEVGLGTVTVPLGGTWSLFFTENRETEEDCQSPVSPRCRPGVPHGGDLSLH